MSTKVTTDDIPRGKFRAIERFVKEKRELRLGDFDSFEEAEGYIKETFRSRGMGWFGYYIYNEMGKLIFTATATKKKHFLFTKTTFVSEVFSFR